MKHIDFSQSVNVVSEARALRDDALQNGTATVYRRYGKRAFDLALALVMLPVLAPLIAALAIAVRRDGGPGLFGHMRIGQDGVMFRCWKIRTMVADSETRLAAYLDANPEARAEWERDHKLSNDPRVTPLGRFLRKTSLDELPQLWNVLKGDMSFVGPRPIVLAELAKYGSYQAAYLAMKPGVTGLWQVSGRNDVTYEERVLMDVDYMGRISLPLDVQLIAKTALAVLHRTGK